MAAAGSRHSSCAGGPSFEGLLHSLSQSTLTLPARLSGNVFAIAQAASHREVR